MDDNESRASRIEQLKQKRLARKKVLESNRNDSTNSSAPVTSIVDIANTKDNNTPGNINNNDQDTTKDNSSETRSKQFQSQSLDHEPSMVELVEHIEDPQATVKPAQDLKQPNPIGVTDDLKHDIQHYLDKSKALTDIEINKIIQKRYEESMIEKD